MELSDWQVRLEQHFELINKNRSTQAPGKPIFGLEHGLNATELRDLSGAIRKHIKQKPPSKNHILPWIVYASELGYIYSGDEYWQTFEEETPGWTDYNYGNRYWLRSSFLWFHEKFGGAKPSGRWADHFSIICWPITHAVLPQDLQRQLARILYEIRHSFSAELFASPLSLGQSIAARSWNATSRFQNLAEENLLVGQIAAALLLQGEFGTSGLLFPATLKRISEDLDRERLARDWLRDARRFAKERARIRGIILDRSQPNPDLNRPERARAEVQELGIEPRLVLRPADIQKSSWDITIEIPDLSHLIFRFPNLRDILANSRCLIAGSNGRPLARGSCLYGMQRIGLIRWPQPSEVLLQFDKQDTQLEYLLRTECLLRPGPNWLFRIASDGLAYEMRSMRVRSGEKYIIISSEDLSDTCDLARPIKLSCAGVNGFLIDLPSALSEEWENELLALGLSHSKLIEVWPAGLAAAVWDGEGYCEWLASERPCLAVRSDHPMDSLIISMDRSTEILELTSIVPGLEIFIELPELPVGLHTLHFTTRNTAIQETEALGELDVVMRIRMEHQWSPGLNPSGPLSVQIEPPSPTLEQVWEGRIEIALRGPEGRQVKCRISLFERDAQKATMCHSLPSLSLPITSNIWRSHFERHFRKLKTAENAYDTARYCELEFHANELGSFKITCEREFTPIRWTVRRDGQHYNAQLFDDSGSDIMPTVSHYNFEEPCTQEKLDFSSRYKIPHTGGLYVAEKGDFITSIIIPPEIRGLTDLRCVPRFVICEHSADSVLDLIRCCSVWGNARLSGNLLSSLRQRDIMLALIRQIFLILGGKNWERAETSAEGEDWLQKLKFEVSRRNEEVGLGAALSRDYAALSAVSCHDRVSKLSVLAAKYLSLPPSNSVRIGSDLIRRRPERNPEDTNWLCELALRLSSSPADVPAWAGQNLRAGIMRLLEKPTISRAARFLVIATDCHSHKDENIGELYPNWRWT